MSLKAAFKCLVLNECSEWVSLLRTSQGMGHSIAIVLDIDTQTLPMCDCESMKTLDFWLVCKFFMPLKGQLSAVFGYTVLLIAVPFKQGNVYLLLSGKSYPKTYYPHPFCFSLKFSQKYLWR